MSPHEFADGKDWEANVKQWLLMKYPNEFQSVPAMDGGDAGIEGYCISERTVYQCYAALPNLDTRTLYNSQRDKLTEDVSKFTTNVKRLTKILPAGFKVRRYAYLVPEYRSSDLVAHANKKAQEVRSANLSYVDPEFEIVIRDPKFFAVEIAEEKRRVLKRLHLDIAEVAVQNIHDWVSDHDEGVQNLERKIKLYTHLTKTKDIRRLRDHWIRAKITTDNALEKLRMHSEEVWEELWSVRRGRERLLDSTFGTSPGTGGEVNEISAQLASDMMSRVPNLDKLQADIIADVQPHHHTDLAIRSLSQRRLAVVEFKIGAPLEKKQNPKYCAIHSESLEGRIICTGRTRRF